MLIGIISVLNYFPTEPNLHRGVKINDELNASGFNLILYKSLAINHHLKVFIIIINQYK